MKLKLTWLMTLFMAFTIQFSYAQGKTVTGTVTEKGDGMPLPGVSVIVKGTTTGVQTDFDGKYSISTKAGDVLVFSFVGMKNAEVTVGASNTYNVSLEGEGGVLEEVVVVGYGKTTREAFTGSASVVKMEELETKTITNVSQALKGEISGVTVVQTSGAPGRDAAIRIRGFGSVNGNQAPLYVVDGAPFASDLSAINPADIESMTVLKDAAATSIYGSRGANGVILITTKQGKQGKTRISVDFKTSINTQFLPNYDIVDSPEQYIELAWLSLKNKASLLGQADPAAWASTNLYGTAEGIHNAYNIWNVPGSQIIDPATGRVASGVARKFTPTKWSDAAFGTGLRSEANLQFNGGNDKTRFNTSFGYLDDRGYDVNSRYTRYSVRLNVETKATDWLTIGGNIAYSAGRYNNATDLAGASSSGNVFALTNTTPAIYDVYLRDLDGNLVEDPIFGGYQYDYGNLYGRRAWTQTNGIADAHYDLNLSDGNTLLGNFNATIDITDWLAFETRYSGQLDNWTNSSVGNPYYGAVASDGGSLFKDIGTGINQNFLQLLRFNKEFGNHSVEAFVAHETTEDRFNQLSGAALKAIIPNSLELSHYTVPFGRSNSYRTGWTLESYFAQLNYNFDRKYYLTASARRDGSSRFINDKWGTFGSVGLGWVVSKEDFFSGVKFIDYLKLKASYGVIGDQGTSLQYGWQLYGINQTPDGSYSFTQSATLANPDLTWETSKIAQVGIESSWFNNTLDLNVDYYIKNTDNLFFNQSLPPSSGFTTIQYNDGQLRNSGIEFDATVHVFKPKSQGDFRLSASLNGEILNNEITKMPKDYMTGNPKVLDGQLAAGHSLYDWYMREWAGVDPGSGAALWYQYYHDVNDNGILDAGDVTGNFFVDDNGDGQSDNTSASLFEYMQLVPDAVIRKTTTSTYANATQKYVGKSAIPKVRGGFRLSAAYKNFDLSAQFSYNIGGYLYDFGYAVLMDNGSLIGGVNWHQDMENSWRQPGDITNVPRMSANHNTDTQHIGTSTRFLTKADYLSLNNLNLGYTLPEAFTSKMSLSKFNVYVSGDNLLMFSARKGLNPTTMIGTSSRGAFMPMTTFSLGAKIEF